LGFLEVARGAVLERSVSPGSIAMERLDTGVAQPSAPNLRTPRVDPGAPVEWVRFHPRTSHWTFALSREVPRVMLALPVAAITEIIPAIRTVLLEPVEDRVVVVWVAELHVALPVGPAKRAKTRFGVRW
jgi:hypothetical protein